MDEKKDSILTPHVLSDSRGNTARAVVNAAVVQFPREKVAVSQLTRVGTIERARLYLDRYVPAGEPTAVFHTILDGELRSEVGDELQKRGIPSVDLLGPTMRMVASLVGEEPMNVPGLAVDRKVTRLRSLDARMLDVEG